MAGPWEEYQKKPAEAGPWTEYQAAPQEKPKPSSWKTPIDFFKFVGKNVGKGLTDFGALEQSGSQMFRGISPGAEELAPQQRPGATGAMIPESTGPISGPVGAGIRAIANPLSYLGGGGVPAAAGSGVGGYLGEKVGGPVGGFIGGAAGGIGGARAMQPRPPATAPRTVETRPAEANNPTLEAAAKAARAMGIEPPAGNVRQSPGLRNVEQLGGDTAALNAERQVTAKSAGLMGTMGDNLDPKLLEDNMTRLKGDFERSTNQLSIVLDEKNSLLEELTELRKDYSGYVSEEVQKKLDRLIRDASPYWENELGELETNTKFWTDGAMEGKAYHSMVKTGSKMDEAIHGGQADLAPNAYKIRQILDQALERSSVSPAQQQALALFKKTKEEYFNQKVLNKAIVRKAEEGKRIGLVDSEKLYNELQTYGWDGGGAKTPLQQLALSAVSTVPRSKPAGLFSAGHEAGSGRWAARSVGGAIGSAIGGGAGAMVGGVPGFAYGAGVGASLGSAAGPRIAGKIANSPRVQNFLKTNRDITKAVRAKVGKELPSAKDIAVRGTVGEMSAKRKKERERPRIYEE